MSAALASSTAADGHRAIMVAALMATYMQAVNISLPNAALLHIQGALSMADDEVGWIFTSYIAASVITMPMTRWLAGRYGRKAVYQISIAVFALGLVLDTLATTPMQFVAARIVQGAASGTLAPLSMAILLDMLPPARHARINLVCDRDPAARHPQRSQHRRLAQRISRLALDLLFRPAGGGHSSSWRWRSRFRRRGPSRHPPFDFFGLATFSLGMIGLQMLLDRGERLEWFDSAEIWAEAAASVLGFYSFSCMS